MAIRCPTCGKMLRRYPVLNRGYYLVRCPGHPAAMATGYAYEHRLVAAEALGRDLLPGEVVHHRNGSKLDNRPSNLEVMSASAHRSLHNRERFRGPGPYFGAKERVPKRCAECGGGFAVQPHRADTAKFCSPSCRMRSSMRERWKKSAGRGKMDA